jgi:hypothetical protein
MAGYIISPKDTTDWHEDPDEFAAAVRERWPDADVKLTPESEAIAVDAWLPDNFELMLLASRSAVGTEGDVAGSAEVAAWWRRRVPAEIELLFYDDLYNADVPVEPGAHPEALAEAYRAAARAV